ncbi:hypothetical protein KUTeg_013208 [Tegillarca granosa]|uniref:Protein kinase domain-containing protein n=1 Tax=Tegillarca granosa TaxID=220873 RepID=A0ABQ9ET07_TEGGR|nr:hypothetical protein KUTeg_013207 [Tegillarca granosa]KAJ8308334.1 hypothetical protein KUTeg_013208 [Tegillarca granosa]
MPFSKVTVSQCLAIIERMLEPEVEKRATIEEIMNSQSVAIKQLKKSNGMKDFIAREIKTMLSLNHENIIKVYDVIETKKNIAIVMELAEGGDLLEKVMKNTLSMEDTKRIFREIVTALAHCHSQNIVHRDLKLENVLLGKDGKVKLADFGFARKIENALWKRLILPTRNLAEKSIQCLCCRCLEYGCHPLCHGQWRFPIRSIKHSPNG